MEQLNLACELAGIIRHFFPDLVPMLRQLPDPRRQSYITYPGAILLMTRILSAIFYIGSMRKTSEELNSDTVIENIWELCGEPPAIERIWKQIKQSREQKHRRILESFKKDKIKDHVKTPEIRTQTRLI